MEDVPRRIHKQNIVEITVIDHIIYFQFGIKSVECNVITLPELKKIFKHPTVIAYLAGLPLQVLKIENKLLLFRQAGTFKTSEDAGFYICSRGRSAGTPSDKDQTGHQYQSNT